MRLAVLSCVALAVAWQAVHAQETDFYDSRYDYLDIDAIMDNKRLVRNYVQCLLNQKPCSPEGKALRRILPEGLRTKCARCTPRQKHNALQILRRLRTGYPEEWARLAARWDPQGDFTRRFEDFLGSDEGNKIDMPLATRPTTTSTTSSPLIGNRFGEDGEQGSPSEVQPTVRVPPGTTQPPRPSTTGRMPSTSRRKLNRTTTAVPGTTTIRTPRGTSAIDTTRPSSTTRPTRVSSSTTTRSPRASSTPSTISTTRPTGVSSTTMTITTPRTTSTSKSAVSNSVTTIAGTTSTTRPSGIATTPGTSITTGPTSSSTTRPTSTTFRISTTSMSSTSMKSVPSTSKATATTSAPTFSSTSSRPTRPPPRVDRMTKRTPTTVMITRPPATTANRMTAMPVTMPSRTTHRPRTTTRHPFLKPLPPLLNLTPIYQGTMGLIDHFGNKIIKTTELVTGLLKNTVRVVVG